MNADPMLANIASGQEDLRLQPASPARDLIPVSGMTEDVFGNPRPMGAAYDAGAHEYPAPRMEVEYNAAPVANSGTVHVGQALIFGETRTFTIRNTHPGDLLLTGTPPVVLTPGSNLAAATVQTQPALTTVPPNGSTTFTIYIEPAAAGPFDLQISIDNSDLNNNPYTFTVTGIGITNDAARGDPAPGSSFTGPPGGPYYYALDPGMPLSNAEIVLTDLESDTITVTTIGQINPPVGVIAPTVPPPGHPITLAWTGVMDAGNPIGNYQYIVSFHDAVNGTPVSVTLFISNNDLPPAHAIAGASSGDGSPGNPYTATYTEGDGPALVVDLALLSDPNAGQAVTLNPVHSNPGNPGTTGFTFTAGAGMLRVAPAGTLQAADAGAHSYVVPITDGTHVVDVYVSLIVNALPPPPPPVSIGTLSLPDGVVGASYAQTIQTSGGVGAITFSVTAGALPTGLLLNANTGEITGKPTQSATETFTIQAQDTIAQTDTKQFVLTIHPAPTPPDTGGDGGSGGGNSGCVSAGIGIGSGLLPVALLVALAGLAVALRRRVLAFRGLIDPR